MASASNRIKADICVIGSGAAGLSVAAGAVQMGAKVVLIEKNLRRDVDPDGVMGGDCLHVGCVPSKAILAAAKHAHRLSESARFGVDWTPGGVDFRRVHAHVHEVIAAIAPIDGVKRYRDDLGVDVIEGEARFVSNKELRVGDTTVRARRFVVATGSKPRVPPIEGLESVPYFTNETLWDNRDLPDHLIVIGGGPIGMEMAQAHKRLGARVTVLDAHTPLPKDDPELTAVVLDRLKADGVDILDNAKIEKVGPAAAGGVQITVERNGTRTELTGSHLLVATGRAPTVTGLDLEKAGVAFTERGIEVDARLRTSNKKIYAIGDCVGGLQFTHLAGYHAGIVVRNAVLRLPSKANESLTPWVTYTDPELAHIGLTEAKAREKHGDKVRVVRWSFEDNDRAQAERETQGFLKLVALKNGHVLGVSIVGAHAGELLYPWLLMIGQNLKLSAMTGIVAPYPTLGEVSKRAAGEFYAPTIFGPLFQRYVRLVRHLP